MSILSERTVSDSANKCDIIGQGYYFPAPVLFESISKKMMNRSIIHILLLVTFISIHGCIVGDNESENPDRGTYTLACSDSTMSTYPGGGDVVILAATHSEYFSGSIRLSVKSDNGIHAVLKRTSLTPDNPVTEIVIQPDSTLAVGLYTVTLFHKHGSFSDTLTFPVNISRFVNPVQYQVAHELLYEFIEWGHDNHSALKDIDRDSFFLYAISNMAIGGSGTWVAVNDQWEMHFYWTGSKLILQLLLRKIGNKDPTYFFVKDREIVSVVRLRICV
jgi:hypothetical protein